MENNKFIISAWVNKDYCFNNLVGIFVCGILTDVIKNEKYSKMMLKVMLIDTLVSSKEPQNREFDFDNTIYKNFVNLQNNFSSLIGNMGILINYFTLIAERETNIKKVLRDVNDITELSLIESKLLFELPLLHNEILLVKNFIIESYKIKKQFSAIDLHGVQKEEDVEFLFNFLFGKFDTYLTEIANSVIGKQLNEPKLSLDLMKKFIKEYIKIDVLQRMDFLKENFNNIFKFLEDRKIYQVLSSMNVYLENLMKFGEIYKIPLVFTLQN